MGSEILPGRQCELLCSFSDLDLTGAFGVERDHAPREIIVVKRGAHLHAYVNSCPHKGTPLEMIPNRFLDETKTQLICTTHGARFDVETGICTFGPCKGEALVAVKIKRQGNKVYLDDK